MRYGIDESYWEEIKSAHPIKSVASLPKYINDT